MHAALMTFSAVMILCAVCNVIGMTLGIKPPPMVPWFVGWLSVAIGLAAFAAIYS